MRRVPTLSLLLVAMLSSGLGAVEAELRYVDPITELTYGCFRLGMMLDVEPSEGALRLEGAVQPLYGVLRLTGGAYPLVIDRGTEPAALYVDIDQDGALTSIAWERSETDEVYRAHVTLTLYYDEDAPQAYSVFVAWDPRISTLLVYCRGAYYEGMIELGGETYRVAILDEDTDGRYDDLDAGTLFIDADLDGELTSAADSHEAFRLIEPFNLGGVTYEVVSVLPDGTRIRIEESDRTVSPKLPLGIGFPAPPFEAETLDGETISLEALTGSIVLLDFWAGWCGPCVAELPTIIRLHEEYKDQGVEIIGVNRDRSHEAFVEAVERFELDYTHIFDGDETISSLYRIAGIPMTYLLDREGKIVARGLRGGMLEQAIDALLDGASEESP
jgi:thiol-disulfide isomerase/thioredoxin